LVGLRSREPGAGSREPGAGSREPGAGSREPGAGSREPGAGSREPGAGSREPLHVTLTPRGCYKLAWHPRGRGTTQKARYTCGDAHGIIYTAGRPATPGGETPTGSFTPSEGPLHLRRRPRKNFYTTKGSRGPSHATLMPKGDLHRQKARYTCGDAQEEFYNANVRSLNN
jgi:hypothetical protein